MKTFLSLTIAAIALSASPAAAHSVRFADDGSYRISVPYGDLNLASPAGVETLKGRINAATKAVCGTPRARSVAEARAVQTCRQDVWAAARPKMMLALKGEKGSIALASSR